MEDLQTAWEQFVKFVEANETEFQIVAVLVPTVLLFIIRISRGIRWVFRQLWLYLSARSVLSQLFANLHRIQRQGRWSEPVLSASRELQDRQRDSKPVIMVANHKGGVGKTTLAANLGVYFAAKHDMNVLFVDLDWQGTLTATLRRLTKIRNEIPPAARVERLLRDPFPEARAERFFDARLRLQGVDVRTHDPTMKDSLRSSAFYAASDTLADVEDWLMIKWAAFRNNVELDDGERDASRGFDISNDDDRFRLLRFLLSEKIQGEFDIVILDAPPRDTTAGINGLCAATHLVVPTRVDEFSTAGAYKFMSRVAEHKDRLAPNAKMLGFVPTMIARRRQEPATESQTRASLIKKMTQDDLETRRIQSLKPISSYFPSDSNFDFLPALYHSSVFRNVAGRSIAYLDENAIRKHIVDKIGDAISERMGLPKVENVENTEDQAAT